MIKPLFFFDLSMRTLLIENVHKSEIFVTLLQQHQIKVTNISLKSLIAFCILYAWVWVNMLFFLWGGGMGGASGVLRAIMGRKE